MIMKPTEAAPARNDGHIEQMGGRMMIASRYAECLHRLARQAHRVGPADLVPSSARQPERSRRYRMRS
ncbi:hypothetical protein RGCCGE502_21245 [Rhizobium grahamii CCGE 502]|uniref:Uncharacterized protein n=1 Tax=Rhizobium grahamii CCGE 502 TaxID=990285 RepID=S3HC18_9HYPH|nr:hypothetical protein RGCCGE502_21245 [Rhizobium grahamii CCGE 502]